MTGSRVTTPSPTGRIAASIPTPTSTTTSPARPRWATSWSRTTRRWSGPMAASNIPTCSGAPMAAAISTAAAAGSATCPGSIRRRRRRGSPIASSFPSCSWALTARNATATSVVGGLLRGGMTFLSAGRPTITGCATCASLIDLYFAPTVTVGRRCRLSPWAPMPSSPSRRATTTSSSSAATPRFTTSPTGILLASNPDTAAAGLRSAEITAGLQRLVLATPRR